MRDVALSSLSLDELVARIVTSAIRAHHAFVSDEPIERQREWTDQKNAMQREVQARGGDALKVYFPLLKSREPAVRLAAALGLHRSFPELVLPVFEELRDGGYGGTIATNVRMTIGAKKQRSSVG